MKVTKIDYEQELNEEQCKVVFAGDGPTLVIAGAGSGKTRTVTYRVAYLVERGVDFRKILLVTFTNKAAREMLHRVEALLGVSLEGIWGGTFHHVANIILHREAKKVGYQPGYTILDREDQKVLLEGCIAEAGIDVRARRFPKADLLGNVISLHRNTFLSIEDILEKYYPQFLEFASAIAGIFALYQERKREMNIMDYDDLLWYLWTLLKEDERLRKKYGTLFEYVLVDEYQDTNLIQAEIVDLLSEEHRNLLVVGDDSQSIYSFRGANFANILDFPRKYPDAAVYKLETNYRSTPEILNLANRVILHNTQQFYKTLRSVRRSGEKPRVVAAKDVLDQARFVATRILELRQAGYSLNDMAVLYRAHYQSMELQMELTRRGIPFEVRSGLRFFEQAHIKDVVAYLKIVSNPLDEIAWKRVLKICPGIGKVTASRIFERVKESPDPFSALERLVEEKELPANAQKSAKSLGELLLRLEELEASPSTMIKEVINSGYDEYLVTRYPDHRERLLDLEELANFAFQYQSLDAFLNELALLGEMEAETIVVGGIPDEKLTLSSIHQAKGLEWDVVFVIWLCEGGFPSSYSLKNKEDIEEERRLFYVACTRAKDHLFLCYPLLGESSFRDGRFIRKPSRFLRELDPGTYEKVNLTKEHLF